MKKKRLSRITCLVLSAAILSMALVVTALGGSPYETLKNASLGVLTLQNGTLNVEANIFLDGKEFNDETKGKIYFNESGRVEVNGGEYSYLNYYPNENVSINSNTIDRDWYSAYYNESLYRRSSYSPFYLDEYDRTDPRVVFIEKLVDLAVGDLKNNLTMSEENGVKTVSGTLTASQFPEIVNSAIDLAVFSMNESGIYLGTKCLSFDKETETFITERMYIRHGQVEKQTYNEKMTRDEYSYMDEKYTNSKNLDDLELNYDNLDILREQYYECGYYSSMSYDYREPEYIPITKEIIEAYSEGLTDAELIARRGIKSASIDFITGSATINKDNIVTSLTGEMRASFTDHLGENHEAVVYVSGTLDDIGSTILPGAPTDASVLTKELFEKMTITEENRYGYSTLYFKLKPDGAIDESTITAIPPWATELVRIALYDTTDSEAAQ